jgi:hypothetical protein
MKLKKCKAGNLLKRVWKVEPKGNKEAITALPLEVSAALICALYEDL